MRTIYLNFINILAGLLAYSQVSAQHLDSLSRLLDQYVSLRDSVSKYDLVTEIMERNAELSLNDVEDLYKYYQRDEEYDAILAMVKADVYYYQNQLDSSKVYYLNTALEAEEKGDHFLAYWGMGNYAYSIEQEGHLVKALQLRKAGTSNDKLDPKSKANIFYSIGNLYLKLGQLDSAIVYIKKTIEMDRIDNNPLGLVHDLQFIIELNFRSGNYDEAATSCLECLELGDEIGYDRGRAMCYYLYAEVLREERKYNEAMVAIDSAIGIDERRKDMTRMSKIFLAKAMILDAMDSELALQWYNRSKDFGEKENNMDMQAKAVLGLSSFYARNGDYGQSEQQLNMVGDILQESDFEDTMLKYLEQLYQVKVEQGKWKEANQVLEQRIEILTANLNELLTSKADHIDQSFDLYEAQREYERLQYEKEINELKSRRWANLYMGGAVILLLTSLLWYYAYQNQKNKMVVAQTQAEEEHLITHNRILKKEMDSLRSQMNPHFLFNSLNSINDYVMHQDSRLASLYLTKFSKLMRLILNNSKEELISLESEIEAVKLYMELEKLRFKEKFDFDMSIDDDINPGNVFIPAMLIQPFLENAVKHGMKNLDRKGKIFLSIFDEKNRLFIRVRDNGVGREKALESVKRNEINRRSYGMEITSDRIDLLNSIYEIDAVITYKDLKDPSGTEVIISFIYLPQKIQEWKVLKQSS